MKRNIFILNVVIIFVASATGIIFYRTEIFCLYKTFTTTCTAVSDTIIQNANTNISFEIATTTTAKELGLSGRAVVPDNYAMVFVFHKDGMYGFWMKDMLVPIDIVWLSDNGTIIGIENSVQPDTYPHIFYPPEPVRYVLETRAGFSAERKWHIGSVIALPRQ